MRFASSISATDDYRLALKQLLEPIDGRLTAGMVDLVLLFCTGDFADDLPDILEGICTALPNAVALGCTAEGTIGGEQELEGVPSLSLLAASLPDVQVRPFHLGQGQLEAAEAVADWERMVAVAPESAPTFLTLADPFRMDVPGFVERISDAYPMAPPVGGVASAARAPGENRLFIGDQIHRDGVVGVALTGRLGVDTVVSQGCRPIGGTFVITRGERNLIHELGGRTALEALQKVLLGLSEDEEKLARESLFVGRVIDEYQGPFQRGDFLIQGIIGVDRSTGTLGITGFAQVGTTVQFHVRDVASADEDLRALLAKYASRDIRGAMLFGCNGRGTQMWPQPGHDIGVLREMVGDVPVAGCFCGGEFGPIRGRNFVHGFTASIALFRESSD